jgi:hypothetical protein
MATWIRCTPFGDPEGAVFINLDRVVAIKPAANHTAVVYGSDVSADMGQIIVAELPATILRADPVRHA